MLLETKEINKIMKLRNINEYQEINEGSTKSIDIAIEIFINQMNYDNEDINKNKFTKTQDLLLKKFIESFNLTNIKKNMLDALEKGVEETITPNKEEQKRIAKQYYTDILKIFK